MTSSTAEVRARLKAIHPADFSILCDRDYRLPENSDARLLLDATLEYYEELSKIDNEEEEDEDDKQDEEKEKEEEEKETKAQEEKERETKEWKEEEKDAWIQRRQDRKTKRIKLMRMKKMKRMKDKKDKRKGEICRVLGDCYLMQNDIDKAYAAYIRAMCLLPNPTIHWKLWYGAGIMYEHCGYADHAEAVFSPALSVDGPLSPSDDTTLKETLYRLGHPYIQQHKYDKSLVCFEKISRRGHLPFTSTKVDFLIGELYQEKGDYVNAQAAFERVLQESPRHTTAIRRLGWLYQQGGDRDRHVDLAIRHLQHAIDEDLTDAQSWYLLGRAYARTGEHEKALLAYSEAVKYDHDNLEFWCSIGEVYFDTRQYIRAIETYRYVLQVEPCTGEAWIDLGILYITTRQMLEAINAYKKAYDLKPSGRGVDVTRMLFMLRSIQVSGEALPPGVVDIQELRRVLVWAETTLHSPTCLPGPPQILHGHRQIQHSLSMIPLPWQCSLSQVSSLGAAYNGAGKGKDLVTAWPKRRERYAAAADIPPELFEVIIHSKLDDVKGATQSWKQKRQDYVRALSTFSLEHRVGPAPHPKFHFPKCRFGRPNLIPQDKRRKDKQCSRGIAPDPKWAAGM